MIDNQEFIEDSLVTNLYYLRTLRAFCTRVQTALPSKYKNYITESVVLGRKCEVLTKKLLKYADTNISRLVLESEIVVTNYSKELELLTEKLFAVDIDTEITDLENNIKSGPITETAEIVQGLEEINQEALEIAREFLDFSKEMLQKIKQQDLFAYFYNSVNLAMEGEMNLYINNLERLNKKYSTNPGRVLDNEYWANRLLLGLATFLRGELDPEFVSLYQEFDDFAKEFKNITLEYEKMIITPTSQSNMTLNSLELARRFQKFLIKNIKMLLQKEIYFIAPPITLDNSLTSVNYFIYNMVKNENIIKKEL